MVTVSRCAWKLTGLVLTDMHPVPDLPLRGSVPAASSDMNSRSASSALTGAVRVRLTGALRERDRVRSGLRLQSGRGCSRPGGRSGVRCGANYALEYAEAHR